MPKKRGTLGEDFLDRAIPGRKKVDPALKQKLEGEAADEGADDPALAGGEASPGDAGAAAGEAAGAGTETPPAPEKPAAPVEGAGAEKPAAEPAKPAAAAPAPPSTVPLHLYTDTREELKIARAEHARLAKELEDARKPKPEEKKPPEDPEPDAKTQPIEHQEWEVRELRRQNEGLRADLNEIRSTVTARTEEETRAQKVRDFDYLIGKIIDTHENPPLDAEGAAKFVPIPDIKDRIDFLKERLVKANVMSGMTEEEAERIWPEQKRQWFAGLVAKNINPAIAVRDFSDFHGYKPKEAAAAGAAKPAAGAKTPAQKIKQGQERESAARSASAMPGAAPPGKAEEMSAETWSKMTLKEKRAWKAKHPEIKDPLAQIFGDAGAV
jgi:hypothetical protein